MQETNNAFFVIDDYGNGVALPSGPLRLKGWAVAKAGYFITDLRVRIGGRIHPGFYGIPRTDLADHFKANQPFLLGGFEVYVVLDQGENQLLFECCEIAGEWVPLATLCIVGTPSAASSLPPPPEVGAAVFARALRLVLQRATTEPVAAAAKSVADILPVPHVTRYASLPFHGHLHHPPPLQRARFGRVNVEGWLFHETAQIRRVAASVDLQAWQILDYGGALPYVAGLFPQFPNASACRVHGLIDVPSQLPQPLSLRLYADLGDGSWILCHVERNHLYGEEQDKAPYPRFSPITFFQCTRALRSACLQRAMRVPVDRWFFRGLREVWNEYRSRAARVPTASIVSGEPQPSSAKLPGVIVLITHNLNLEGAPLFLLEYARHLATQGVIFSVFSAGEGPLRQRFESLGARVEVVDIEPLYKTKSAGDLRAALRILSGNINLSAADLVVANTLSTYWGIHLAHFAGKPSLFYIHESTTPDSFYHGHMEPATLPVVKAAFASASHVSFLTDATLRYYRPNLIRQNHSINPGWIDLDAIDRFRRENPRELLRGRLAFAPSVRLVINVGTVCDRKGQHIFVRAIDLLWRRHPGLAAQCEFLMIGGRDSPYDHAIVDLVAYFNRPNLRIIPETSEPQRYYGAADLFVCSSYEESFPRVLLEAMAFEVPIVSTDVHGIPEMTRHDREALLVPAGDSAALADAMFKTLTNVDLAKSWALAARHRVTEKYDAATLLPHHFKLASTVAAS